MITSAIFTLVQGLVSVVLAVLPTATLTLPAAPTLGTGATGLGAWNDLLPISEALGLLSLVLTVVVPAILAYKLANWTWRHIPDVAGFGPAGG